MPSVGDFVNEIRASKQLVDERRKMNPGAATG